MFEYHHEFTREVDLPVSQLFDYASDFNNWPLWIDQFDAFHIEKIDNNETTIKGKIKKINYFHPILVVEIEPLKKYQLITKSLFQKQVSIISYQELTSTKSKFIAETTVKGFLTPFLKPIYKRNINKQYAKFSKVISNLEKSEHDNAVIN